MKQLERVKEFDGWLMRYSHDSACCHCEMTFSIYLPPAAKERPVPVIYWLSGLTCTDDNFRTKAGAQRYAAELGIALVIPDTSPRGDAVPDAVDRYDLGQGAGFYLNASQEPWSRNYQMYDYITQELPTLIETNFPVIEDLRSISGHSMGGHGALVCALKNPSFYRSVSAFSPICHPVASAWGKTCFQAYLGGDEKRWREFDATELLIDKAELLPCKIDQGTEDEFLADYLFPQHLVSVCEKRGIALNFMYRQEYDHGYHFVASFIGEHLAFHAQYLTSMASSNWE
ncbi:MAG: S-formylglutathione hydrolase [Gammaproteobacteria bacterium]|nr:S-formylglutathione hydrolase [Gammaproteobacteria bacterium]